ncbi:MAG: hypothetical protein AB1714_23030 [Acidobacteriota bacterium]
MRDGRGSPGCFKPVSSLASWGGHVCEIDYFSQHGQDRFVDLHVFRKKRYDCVLTFGHVHRIVSA